MSESNDNKNVGDSTIASSQERYFSGNLDVDDSANHTVIHVKQSLTAASYTETATRDPTSAFDVKNKNNANKRKNIHSTNNQRSQSNQRNKQNQHAKGGSTTPKLERPRIPILHYDNDWVCVNKPAQMSVHRSGDVVLKRRGHHFVVASLLKRQLSRKVWPVHRLDHRTSGALLFAFSSRVAGQLHASLTSKTTGDNYADDHNDDGDEEEEEEVGGAAVKEYVAMLRGGWTNMPETVLVDRPLIVKGVSKEAQTEFRLLAFSDDTTAGIDTAKNNNTNPTNNDTNNNSNHDYQGACSLVMCRLLTGRKHQIRRHAHAIGHPVLGDSEHGDSKVNRWWRENRGLNRLFLHCLSLDLPPLQPKQPEEKEQDKSRPSKRTTIEDDGGTRRSSRIQIVAPLSPELSQVLQHPQMKPLWDVAVQNDPRMALEPYDQTGGTLGGRATRQRANDKLDTGAGDTS